MASTTVPNVASATSVVWQPDDSVSACPLCQTVFTWYFRKHHCRRCGRVVCNKCCSNFYPIPANRIVRPTEPHPLHLFLASESSSGGGDGDEGDNVEEVRTCDGCFSRLEQDRCRRMLGLDIATLDPRVAAQIIRDSTNSPSVLASPPPSYSRASHLPNTNAAGAQIPGTGIGPRARRSSSGVQLGTRPGHRGGHRRRSAQEDTAPSSSSTPSSRPVVVVPTRLMEAVVPLRYVSFELNDQDKMLGEECPICFEEYEAGQKIARLECWCVFHVSCIQAWKSQGTVGCPLHFHD